MTRRSRLVFDRPEMPLAASQEPRRRPPQDHRCQAPGCQAWASYGIREPGIAGLRKPVQIWTCAFHRPETRSA